jgi:DNA polymerase-3 subunit gamma/tau
MLEVSEAEAAALKDQSKMASAEGLTRIMEVLADTEMRLRDAASKKILVEVALLKSIEARNAISIDSVLKQLQALREGSGGDVVSIPVPAPASAPRPKPFRAESSAPAPGDSNAAPALSASELQENPATVVAPNRDGQLESLWANLLEAVGRASPFTKSYLLEAHPVSFKNNLLVIGFAPEFQDHIGLVDNSRNQTLLQTKLSELGNPNCQVKFIKADAPIGRQKVATEASAPTEEPVAAVLPAAGPALAAKPAPAIATARSAVPQNPPAKDKLAPIPFNKEDFKNDPLIQKALEIFKGQIVEVRA